MVPAIVYGGDGDPVSIMLREHELRGHLKVEAFYSQLLTLKLEGKNIAVVLRALQRHPSEDRILHLDLLRVREDQEIRMHVPIHYLNEDTCTGVKQEGGIVSHIHSDVEIACLPKDLPEYIEVDILELKLGETLHFSDMQLPEGVKITTLMHGGEEADEAIVGVIAPRAAAIEEEEAVAEGEAEAGAEEDQEKEQQEDNKGDSKT